MSVSFETLALAKRYTREAVADAIGGVTKIDFRFVETLPLIGDTGIIYCVPVNIGDASDLYDEYYYINGHFERLPGVRIDLTPYATKNWVTGEGYYKKSVDGIPETDLDAATKAALAKAKTALQEHQSLAAYRTAIQQDEHDATEGYYKKPVDGIPETDLDAATKVALAKAKTALQEHQSLSAYRTAIQQDEHDAAYIEKLNNIEANAQVNVDEIVIENDQPSDPNVKLWIYQNPGQKVEIPTMDDFHTLQSELDEQVIATVSDWLDENLEIGDNISY